MCSKHLARRTMIAFWCRTVILAGVAILCLLALTAPALARVEWGRVAVPAACTELIDNGSFETPEFAGWQTDGSPWLGDQAHDGIRSGALGGNDNRSDQFYQEVTLPAAAGSASLDFWWYVETTESGGPYDYLYIEVQDAAGTPLNTLEAQSNASTTDNWQHSSIDLTSYPDLLGLTVRIVFRGATDASNPTTFYIDEVSLQTCTPTCPYDWKEPNNDFFSAAAISTGISYYTLYLCPSGDEDWFQFDAGVGDALDVQLYNLPADYDLVLYRPDGTMAAGSWQGGTTAERIQWEVSVAGNYRALVYGYEGVWSAGQYTLRVDLNSPATATPTATTAPCPGDAAGNSFYQAAAIMPQEISEPLCPAGDEDWFRFAVVAGQQITLQLYDLPADYDLALYSPANMPLETGGQSGTTGEQIFHTAVAGGDYRARIHSPGGAASHLPYRFRLILGALPTSTATPTATPTLTPTATVTSDCPTDRFEPNDSFDQARYMARYASVRLCPGGDEDWFKIIATAGQQIEVKLYNLPADFDLAVLDPVRNPVGESHQPGYAAEVVQFTAAVSGDYRVRVYSASGAYGLSTASLVMNQLSEPTPLLFSRKVHSQPFDLVIDGSTVWWSELSGANNNPPGGIYANDYGGDPSAPRTLYTAPDFSPADLAHEQGTLFVRDQGRNWVLQVSTSATPAPAVVLAIGSNLAGSRGIEADTLYAYWGDDTALFRGRLSDQAQEALVMFGSAYGTAHALTSDGQTLYWTDTRLVGGAITERVHRRAKDGSGAVTTASSPGAGALAYIDVLYHASTSSPQQAYVASASAIYVTGITGAGPLSQLYAAEPGATITGLAVDADYIYWTETDPFGGSLLYMPRGGGYPRTILTGLNNPRGLIDDVNVLLWSEVSGVMMTRTPDAMDGAAPRVQVSHAPWNSPVGGSVTLTAAAQDPDGIREMEIRVDGKLAKRCTASPCSHTFTLPNKVMAISYLATATDTQGFEARTPSKRLLAGNTGTDTDLDGLSDALEAQLCTDPRNPDTDKDELMDGWEVLGQKFSDGYLLDLPGLGANPCRPDIFVEMDWHPGWAPDRFWLQRVINEFAGHGVALHVDTGQMGGGSEIPAKKDAPDFYENTHDAGAARDPYSDPHRTWAFHYTVNIQYCGSPSYADTGSNFTLICERSSDLSYAFMHELGHTLGMGHGGTSTVLKQRRDADYVWYEYSWINTNYKPNYLSTMNYAQSFVNYWTGTNLVTALAFSEAALPALDENHLDERPTSAYAAALAAYPRRGPGKPVMIYYCKAATPPYRVLHDGAQIVRRYNYDTKSWESSGWPALNGIDWNCDGKIEADVKADINDDGGYSVLGGNDDWGNLPLKTPCINPSGYYSAAYRLAADNPPCNRTLSRSVMAAAPSDIGDETPHPDPSPFDDPIWELPHELCDGEDNDGDGAIDDGCPDADSDGLADELDNCPFTPNLDQADVNRDWVGDACQDPLAPPGALLAQNIAGGVLLTWTAGPAPDVMGYLVQRAVAGQEPVFAHLGGYPTVGAGTAFFDHTLTAPGRYRYRVQALSLYGTEGEAAEVEVDVSVVSVRCGYLPLVAR